MPKIEYVPKRFGQASLDIIRTAEDICREYASQGLDLTLRQLYYQFVSRALIPNNDRQYKRLGEIIADARLAGMIDWYHIMDRTRSLRGNNYVTSPADVIESVQYGYLTERWSDQDTRVEVWIEKDALVGVLDRPCDDMDVRYFSCRGYTSASAMWRAAQRLQAYEEAGQETVILHLGDHDPSGIDMTRDIQERLGLFGAQTEVKRIALTMDQVEQYAPPPNPAKLTDARAQGYIERYGYQSWELDALDPRTIGDLVRNHVRPYRDDDLWSAATERMQEEQGQLAEVAERWPEIRQFLEDNPR
jgi:hypothetical protein